MAQSTVDEVTAIVTSVPTFSKGFIFEETVVFKK